jgi:hypothetical protein
VADDVPLVEVPLVDVPVVMPPDVLVGEPVPAVSVPTGTMVEDVSFAALDVDSDVVTLVSLVEVSVLLHPNISSAARALTAIHFMLNLLLHSHELLFILATIFATSM